jgi:hypothetical protein
VGVLYIYAHGYYILCVLGGLYIHIYIVCMCVGGEGDVCVCVGGCFIHS